IREFSGASQLHIYPNPFRDKIHFDISAISDTTKNVDIKIYDVTGKRVISQRLEDLTSELVVVSDLAPGVYILEMKNTLFTRKCKIIKGAE
ncbi:MAG: T9SS type A sorting domain-containing protein, partial [Bacteroidetes bacterium]|nr:T9SS type A sorting domain-containing protein [Bacteroidota bacterium]